LGGDTPAIVCGEKDRISRGERSRRERRSLDPRVRTYAKKGKKNGHPPTKETGVQLGEETFAPQQGSQSRSGRRPKFPGRAYKKRTKDAGNSRQGEESGYNNFRSNEADKLPGRREGEEGGEVFQITGLFSAERGGDCYLLWGGGNCRGKKFTPSRKDGNMKIKWSQLRKKSRKEKKY